MADSGVAAAGSPVAGRSDAIDETSTCGIALPASEAFTSAGTVSDLGRRAVSSGCEKSAGVTSPGVMMTLAPILVQPHIFTAKSRGIRIHPCDAGYPGSAPACIAMPDQVMRCM